MPETNRVAIQISDDDATAIDTELTSLEEKLANYLIALSTDERRGLPKMKDKTYAFVQKTVDYTASDPNFVPDFMDAEALKIDFGAVSTLNTIFRRIEKLRGNLDDTILLSGSEAYNPALHYYNSVKMSARANVPGAKEIYEDLKQRFGKNG
ncbi:MAG: hypothetical protein Q7J65_02240 [Candidatus Marinimicrobia bacterium]|nr:hypothetical protein [Candidatus Neomarinimicrobiota bacterium]